MTAFHTWWPPFAPHVIGEYEEREAPLEGEPARPQRVRARCTVCGDEWVGECPTGNVKSKIARYAVLHRHADPMGGTKA